MMCLHTRTDIDDLSCCLRTGIPAGLLPRWLLVVSAMAVMNGANNFLNHSFSAKVYSSAGTQSRSQTASSTTKSCAFEADLAFYHVVRMSQSLLFPAVSLVSGTLPRPSSVLTPPTTFMTRCKCSSRPLFLSGII